MPAFFNCLITNLQIVTVNFNKDDTTCSFSSFSRVVGDLLLREIHVWFNPRLNKLLIRNCKLYSCSNIVFLVTNYVVDELHF